MWGGLEEAIEYYGWEGIANHFLVFPLVVSCSKRGQITFIRR